MVSHNRALAQVALDVLPEYGIGSYGDNDIWLSGRLNVTHVPPPFSRRLAHACVYTLRFPFEGNARIRTRGHSSRLFDKKSYKLETSVDVDLFVCDDDKRDGLATSPVHNEFALHGPFSDKTLIRNLVMMQLMAGMQRGSSDDDEDDGSERAAAAFVPRAIPIELTLNGAYEGVYVLMETVTIQRLRLTLRDDDEDDDDDDRNRLLQSKGFFVKVDHPDRISTSLRPHLWPCTPTAMNVWHLVGSNATHKNDFSRSDLLKVGADIGRALGLLSLDDDDDDRLARLIFDEDPCGNWKDSGVNSRPFRTPTPALDRVDVASWIDQFLVQELGANVDAYFFSTFMHANRQDAHGGGRIRLGPGWDFNLAFGNCFYQGTHGGGDHLQFVHPNGAQISHISDFFRYYLLDDNDDSSADTASVQVKTKSVDDAVNRACALDGLDSTPRLGFRCHVSRRWAQLRNGGAWSDAEVRDLVDAYSSAMSTIDDNATNTSAADRNFERWGGIDRYVWPNPRQYNTYADATRDLAEWILRRLEYMDNALVPLTPKVLRYRARDGGDDVIRVRCEALDPDYCERCDHPIWQGDIVPNNYMLEATLWQLGLWSTVLLMIFSFNVLTRRMYVDNRR